MSLPAWETLSPALNGSQGDYGIYSDILLHRKHAGRNLAQPITSLFGVTDFTNTSESNFKRMIFLSQLAQAMCIKTYVEQLRRGVHTFGALTWQLNDVWQVWRDVLQFVWGICFEDSSPLLRLFVFQNIFPLMKSGIASIQPSNPRYHQ